MFRQRQENLLIAMAKAVPAAGCLTPGKYLSPLGPGPLHGVTQGADGQQVAVETHTTLGLAVGEVCFALLHERRHPFLAVAL